MRLPSFADPANLVTPTEPDQHLPRDIRALELLQMVYRGEVKASPQQMRAAIEALPFENPRMSAVAVGYLTGETFAERLERAIARSDRAKLIEGRVIERND